MGFPHLHAATVLHHYHHGDQAGSCDQESLAHIDIAHPSERPQQTMFLNQSLNNPSSCFLL